MTLLDLKFESPSNETICWRYMSFSKFLDFVVNQRLWYSRLDILRRADPFEGSFTEGIRDYANECIREHLESDLIRRTGAIASVRNLDAYFKESSEEMISNSFMNCWNTHTSGQESVALWRIYGGQDGGLAIETTVDLMRSCLPKSHAIATVKYVPDFSQPSGDGDSSVQAIKHVAYDYEKEIRVMALTDCVQIYCPVCKITQSAIQALARAMTVKHSSAKVWRGACPRCSKDPSTWMPEGIHVQVHDIKSFVQRVIVSPFGYKTTRSTIQELCKRLELPLTVDDSILRQEPLRLVGRRR